MATIICKASMGVRARMMSKPGSDPYTWASSDHLTELIAENVQRRGQIIYSQGLTGSLDRLVGRARVGQYICAGAVRCHLTYEEASIWIARALGDTEGGTSFLPQSSLNAFGMLIDRVGDVFEYQDAAVQRLIIQGRASAQEPDFVTMTAEILAKDESTSPSWPTATPTDVEATNVQRRPMVFSDGTLTIDSTTYSFMAFTLVIDNMLVPRWTNSLTPTSICSAGRIVRLRVSTPFTSSELPLYSNAESIDPSAPKSGSLVFADGTSTITISFNSLQWPKVSPTVPGRQEIPLFTDFIASSTQQVDPPTSGEAEISVTLA